MAVICSYWQSGTDIEIFSVSLFAKNQDNHDYSQLYYSKAAVESEVVNIYAQNAHSHCEAFFHAHRQDLIGDVVDMIT